MTRSTGDLERYRDGYLRLRPAVCDLNTGLPSYALLFDDVRRFFETRDRIAIVAAEMTDAGRMESIYGWQAADRLLQEGAAVVRVLAADLFGPEALIAQDGVYLGRFVVFAPRLAEGEAIDARSAARAAWELRLRLDDAFRRPEFAGLVAGVRFRAAGAVFTEDPFVRFERSVHAAVRDLLGSPAGVEGRDELQAEIRDLIAGRRLEVSSSPIVDLASRRTVGHETVVRGPSGGRFASPAVLLACADEVGLTADLDRAARERALAWASDLPGEGLVFVPAVPSALGPAGDATLSAQLVAAALDMGRLVLQVSERRMQAAGAAAVAALGELRALGLRIALDQAGSGFATLRLIQDLQPDFVKIDPTLVRGIDANLLQQEVARSMAGLAEGMGCSAIATDVETDAEAETVERCGVHLAQGAVLARPRTQAPPQRATRHAPRTPDP